MKKLIILNLLISTLFLFADIPDVEWKGITFELEGDLRTRFAFFNNYDMDYDTSDSKGEADARARLALDISNDTPFSLHSLVEIGNVDLDEFDASQLGELELREMYLGVEIFYVDSKVGIINIKTPGGYVYKDDGVGTQVSLDYDLWDLKIFYTSPTLLSDTLEVAEEFEDINHLLYVGGSFEKYAEWDIWSMALYDNSDDDFYFISAWAGVEGEKEWDKFSVKAGTTYNFGTVTYLNIPISAYFGHCEVEYELEKDWKIYTRYNLTSGDNGDDDNLNQFQVVQGEGNLDTSLGLLFGGSPFSNQSYFSSESLSVVEDSLSTGDIMFEDPGLFTYEFGTTVKFDDLPLPVKTEFVLGGANTGELFSGEGFFYSLIGWELDVHNQVELTKDLDLYLSFAALMAGNSFNGVYELNTGDTLELDTSYKVDCLISYDF